MPGRWRHAAVGLAVLVVAGGVVHVVQDGPMTEQEACVAQASEHREVAFDGPVTDDQIEELGRELLR